MKTVVRLAEEVEVFRGKDSCNENQKLVGEAEKWHS